MRKAHAYLLATLISVTSCIKPDDTGTISLSSTEISCPAEGGEYLISIEGRPDWTTDNTAEWIDVSKEKGGAVFTIGRNTGGARERTVGFRVDGEKLAEIFIIQDNSDTFMLSSYYENVGYKGGSIEVRVTCFEKWEAIPDSEWIIPDTTEGDAPYDMTLTIGHTTEITERTGVVTFRCGEKTLELKITQAPSLFLEIEKDIVEFDGDGGYDSVLYMSNADVMITCTDSWIRLINTDSSIKKVSFEVLRNLSEAREGHIIVSINEGDIFKDLTVTQGPKIDHPALGIAEGYEMEVASTESFTLHSTFTDMSDFEVRWSSSDTDIASVDASGTVTPRKSGECVITAQNPFHSLQAQIKLKIRLKAGSMIVMLGNQNMSESSIAVRFPGEKMKMTAVFDNEDAYSEDVIYFCSDPSVASVTGDMLTCISPGTATIMAESSYQNLSASFTLIVLDR